MNLSQLQANKTTSLHSNKSTTYNRHSGSCDVLVEDTVVAVYCTAGVQFSVLVCLYNVFGRLSRSPSAAFRGCVTISSIQTYRTSASRDIEVSTAFCSGCRGVNLAFGLPSR
jgi:hypothetical protein